MAEEVFGPVLLLVNVQTVSDATAFIQARSAAGAQPLAAYLFTNDQRLAAEFTQSVTAGTIVVNDCLVQNGNLHLPFGGVGESGLGGKFQGKAGFDVFSHTKAVLHRPLHLDMAFRYPPYNERLLRFFLNPKLDRLVRLLRKFCSLRNLIDGLLLLLLLRAARPSPVV